jgi:hydrogenase nickel incorporation protein HypB
MTTQPRLVEVRKNVLKQNDIVARALRERFREAGVLAVSFVSSPGSGKTAFLEKTLTLLHPRYRVAALVGDLATENDAARLARSQAPVRQILTGTVCHLEAAMVQNALEGWDLNRLDFLFIENVGNLVCPSSYDLGEDLRFVLLSVTEGEDKPLKYPTISTARMWPSSQNQISPRLSNLTKRPRCATYKLCVPGWKFSNCPPKREKGWPNA